MVKEGFIDFCYSGMNTDILECFNTVDPLQCFYGNDVNPDEYFGYAKRCVDYLESGAGTKEAVGNSFYVSQLQEGWITLEQIDLIADRVEYVLDLWRYKK